MTALIIIGVLIVIVLLAVTTRYPGLRLRQQPRRMTSAQRAAAADVAAVAGDIETTEPDRPDDQASGSQAHSVSTVRSCLISLRLCVPGIPSCERETSLSSTSC